jgi:hypothetical protein
MQNHSGSLSPRADAAPTFAGFINLSQQPITGLGIPVPQCVWSPPAPAGHEDPNGSQHYLAVLASGPKKLEI